MEFIELVRIGLFDAFWCFTNLWFNIFAYLSVIIGFVIQFICSRKAKTKIRKYTLPIACIIGCAVCECAALSLTGMDLLAVDMIYFLFVYLLIGAIIALIVSLIKKRGKVKLQYKV